MVHDPFMTDTAKYADIVLPAATYLETDDLYRAYGAYWMQWGRQAAKPQGEARSNFDVAQALARRMGLTDAIFTPRRRRMRPRSCSRARPALPPPPIRPSCSPASRSTSRIDCDGQPFKTPSGKLEFYSEQLAKQGVSPMPDWNDGSRRSGRSRQVAAAPADRARLLPGAHGVLGRGLPAPARGQAVLRAASRGRGQARPQAGRRGAACSTTAARSA